MLLLNEGTHATVQVWVPLGVSESEGRGRFLAPRLSVLTTELASRHLCEQGHVGYPGRRILVTVVAHLTRHVRWEEGRLTVAHRELGIGRNRLWLSRNRRTGDVRPVSPSSARQRGRSRFHLHMYTRSTEGSAGSKGSVAPGASLMRPSTRFAVPGVRTSIETERQCHERHAFGSAGLLLGRWRGILGQCAQVHALTSNNGNHQRDQQRNDGSPAHETLLSFNRSTRLTTARQTESGSVQDQCRPTHRNVSPDDSDRQNLGRPWWRPVRIWGRPRSCRRFDSGCAHPPIEWTNRPTHPGLLRSQGTHYAITRGSIPICWADQTRLRS